MASLKNNPEVLALIVEAKLKAEATAYKAAIKAIKAARAPLLELLNESWVTKEEVKVATKSIKDSIAATVAAVQELTAPY